MTGSPETLLSRPGALGLVLALLTGLLPVPATADVAARVEAAFVGWARDVGATEAAITLRRGGVPVHDAAIGMAMDRPVELASVSKAITAVCAATLMESGVWDGATTSREVLGFGPEGITLAGLMTHSAGIGPDRTQWMMWLWLGRPDTHAARATAIALTRPEQSGQAGRYLYNNENYAILGEMIAAQTGQSYVDYCTQAVLRPAGVTTAQPSPHTGSFLPYGGWRMSLQDYAAFHWHAFGPEGIIGRDPSGWPSAPVQGGMSYGVGTFQRPMAGTFNFWHFGALCFPGRLNIGAFAVIWMQDWSLVAAYNVCPTGPEAAKLDQMLAKAVFQ